MTLKLTDLFTPATSGQWLAQLLTNGSLLGLSSATWTPGGIARTILVVLSNVLASSDVVVSTVAQAGFLDTAAAITPDPTLPAGGPGGSPPAWSGTWAPGWLDALASSVYQVTRPPATTASVWIVVTCSGSTSVQTFAPGTIHVASTSPGGATYTNAQPIPVGPAAAPASYLFTCDVVGSVGSAIAGAITQLVTSIIGLTVTNPASCAGFDGGSNAALVAACRNKLEALSPNGPRGAYEYWARNAQTYIQSLPGGSLFGFVAGVPNRVAVVPNPLTGVLTVYVANGGVAGAVPGATGLAVTGASNASPIQITTPTTAALVEGGWVFISGVVGNAAANGAWQVHVVDGTHFNLLGSTGNGGYVSGGTIGASDLGALDASVRANALPPAITASVQSAPVKNIAVSGFVFVPASQVASAPNLVQASIQAYFASLPLGGLTDPNGAYTNIVPIDSVIAAIFGTPGVTVKNVSSLTLNGALSDLQLGPYDVPVLSGGAIGYRGV